MGAADSQGLVVAVDKGGADLSGDKSVLDDTTIDDDEIVDELQPYDMTGLNKAVPTIIEWRGMGEKVYVTGTFVNWERKFRLHKRYIKIFLVHLALFSIAFLELSSSSQTTACDRILPNLKAFSLLLSSTPLPPRFLIMFAFS
jgi:hypothetical protein